MTSQTQHEKEELGAVEVGRNVASRGKCNVLVGNLGFCTQVF